MNDSQIYALTSGIIIVLKTCNSVSELDRICCMPPVHPGWWSIMHVL